MKKKSKKKKKSNKRTAFDKLTMKQKKLVEGLANGKTQRDAGLAAGYKGKYIDSNVSHELNKTQVFEGYT